MMFSQRAIDHPRVSVCIPVAPSKITHRDAVLFEVGRGVDDTVAGAGMLGAGLAVGIVERGRFAAWKS